MNLDDWLLLGILVVCGVLIPVGYIIHLRRRAAELSVPCEEERALLDALRKVNTERPNEGEFKVLEIMGSEKDQPWVHGPTEDQ